MEDYVANANEEDFMGVLVDEETDETQDYLDGVNKEVDDVSDDRDPDSVVEADLAMDPGAATESFTRRMFGLSREDTDEIASDIIEEAAAIPDADTGAIDGMDEDEITADVSVPDNTTVVTVTPPEGGETDSFGGDMGVIDTEISTPEEMTALEHFRRNYWHSTEEEDSPDVSLDVSTPNNDVSLDFEDKAITIEPIDGDTEAEYDSGDDDMSDDTMDEGEETTDDTEEQTEDEETQTNESWYPYSFY